MPSTANWSPPRQTSARQGRGMPQWTFVIFISLFCIPMSFLLVQVPYLAGTAVVVGIAIFLVSFVSRDAGLYVLIFSMLLSPEIAVGGLAGGGTTAGRGVTLRAEDLLLLLLGFAWITRMAVHKELGLFRQSPLNRPIGRYVVACLFATTMGLLIGYVKGITGLFFVLKYIEYFVIYFIVVNNIQTRAQVRNFTAALLGTALIVAIVAIAQIPAGGRVAAPFEGSHGEPNTLGGYLLFVGAITAGLALQYKSPRLKWFLFLLLCVLAVPFLFTLSRSSYLGVPFVYVALTVLHKGQRVAMLLILAGLTAVGSVAMPKAVTERLSYTFSQTSSLRRVQVGTVQLDTSTSARIESWQHALTDAMDSPIWGFGITGYRFLDAQYPRILVETGLIGLVLFFYLIYSVFRESLRLFRESTDPLYRGLCMGLVAGLVGLLVHGIGTNTFIIVRIMEPFWLVVGLVIGAMGLPNTRQTESPIGRS